MCVFLLKQIISCHMNKGTITFTVFIVSRCIRGIL